jgi:hypothetical protein
MAIIASWQSSAVKCIVDNIHLHLHSILEQSTMYHGYSLLNQLLSFITLECLDDTPI